MGSIEHKFFSCIFKPEDVRLSDGKSPSPGRAQRPNGTVALEAVLSRLITLANTALNLSSDQISYLVYVTETVIIMCK